ncbi:MAG: hypothetical protein ACRC17_12020 [Culicoidibacterales bacterium]
MEKYTREEQHRRNTAFSSLDDEYEKVNYAFEKNKHNNSDQIRALVAYFQKFKLAQKYFEK